MPAAVPLLFHKSSPPVASRAAKNKVPPRYNVRSELQADVKAGENTFDFKLES